MANDNGSIVLLVLAMLMCRVLSAGTGRVYVGLDLGNLTETISVNENYGGGSFSIFILLYNETTGESFSSYEGPVTISCELTPQEDGYSVATFTSVTVSNPQGLEPISRDVTYSISTAGREVDLHCWGVSSNAPSGEPQFSKATSISNRVGFTVRKRGLVSICDDIVVVPNRISQTTGTFLIELSEPVEEYNVTVTCTSTPINTGVTSLSLTFQDVQLSFGENKAQVEYSIIETGAPIAVYCEAQSDGQGSSGQFISSTSRSASVVFILAAGEVQLFPVISPLKDTNMQVSVVEATLFLVLNDTAYSQVTFACKAQVVNTTTEARDAAQNPLCDFSTVVEQPSADTGASSVSAMTTESAETTTQAGNTSAVPDNTTNVTEVPVTTETDIPSPASNTTSLGDWVLAQNDVVFEEGDQYQTLNLYHPETPTTALEDLIVVTCCAPEASNNNPIFTGKSAAMLAVAKISPQVPVNWTEAESVDVEVTESSIVNVAWVELAPCPCDLTENVCDADCCCDQDCSGDELQTFNCIPGVEGGEVLRADDYYCGYRSVKNPDWFPFTCVVVENSAFLGYFSYPLPAITSLPTFVSTVSSNTNGYSFREYEKRSPVDETTGTGYLEGISVHTGLKKQTVADDMYIGPNYRLTLPRRGVTGSCLRLAPVRYLKPYDSSCVRTITPAMCTSDSILSAAVYAQSSAQSDPPCPQGPLILQEYGTKDVTTVHVDYLCTADLNGYVRSTTKKSDIYLQDTSAYFAYDIPEVNRTDCVFDQLSGAFTCPLVETSESVDVTIPRCSWDDSYTVPPVPYYNEATNTCENAVIDVRYNFTWQGSELLIMNATVILGDIPMETSRTVNETVTYTEIRNTSGVEEVVTLENVTEVTTVTPTVLSQLFAVEFYPLFVEFNISSLNLTENNTDYFPADRLKRSGNPGYDVSLPVISGVPVFLFNSTDLDFFDTNDTKRLSVWKTGKDGLCNSANQSVINFREDTLGGCALRLSSMDLKDCDYLRQLVLTQQDLLMPSSYISLGGNPNPLLFTSSWIKILREDISWIFAMNDTESTEGTTVGVTEVTEALTTETVNVTVSSEGENSPFDYASQLTGRCENIPAGIHVNILYAETGKANYVPIYNIVGARISYHLTTWEMKCAGVEGAACAENGTDVQTFTITSSAGFTEVSVNQPNSRSRYQIQNDEPKQVCPYDTCLEQLAYPFLHEFTGDSFLYTRAFGLLSVIFAVAFFFVTKPWW